jgi:REP element-mobilizing transposase RayT
MATDKRVLRPKGIYHIYNRGTNKMNLFRETEDFVYFIKKLKYYKDIYDIKIYSSCLMTNHFHIIAQDRELDVPVFMDALESVFATYFIDKYRYKGRVFESRFKSSLILTNKRFLELFRYLARNPLIAKMVDSIFSYPWSTPSEKNDMFNIVDFDYVNEVFKQNCKQNLKEFLDSSVDDCWVDPIETQRMNDFEAYEIYMDIMDRMEINQNSFTNIIQTISNLRFFYMCRVNGLTIRQISDFSGLSRFKINSLLETDILF